MTHLKDRQTGRDAQPEPQEGHVGTVLFGHPFTVPSVATAWLLELLTFRFTVNHQLIISRIIKVLKHVT